MKKSLVLFLTVLFVFTGALAVFAGSKTDGKKAEKIKVGFLVLDLTNPFWNTQAEGAKAKAAEYDNLELIIVDGQSDPAREINAVENWTTQGVDGIMLSAIDAEAVAPYLKRAKEKGIYVVGAIHPVPAVDLDASLTLDEYNFGYMAGTEAGKWINNKLGGRQSRTRYRQGRRYPRRYTRPGA
jgi:ribose transport system substrate-binding protein